VVGHSANGLGIAVEVGGSHATCALVDGVRLIDKRRVDGVSGRLASTLEVVEAAVRTLLEAVGARPGECSGVSLAFCGTVDAGSGRVVAVPQGKFADAPELDLAGWSRRAFGLPLRLENDARLALLGEHWSGAARGYDDVAMITLGTGIGGAAMLGGRLLVSRHHQAGVIGGHIPVSVDGRPCSCGGSGCAEAEASTWALPAICAAWPGFGASSLAAENRIDYRTLFRHHDAGDAVATGVLERSCDVWATLAVTLIHAYDPEVLILGGAVMSRSEDILPRIRAHVHDRAWTPGRKVPIEQAALGEDAPLYGAIPLLGLAA
jgi:glucokinase